MAKAASAERVKRKRPSTHEQPTTKRRRSSASSNESEDPNAKILLMEQGILESKKNYNDITILLSTANDFKNENPESMLATVALCRIFLRLLAQGSLIAKKTLSEKDLVVVGWLKGQFGEVKKTLVTLLRDEELAPTALTLCMRTLKAEGEFLYDKDEYTFPRAFLREILAALFESENEDVIKAYVEEFVEQYDDIRYFTFNSVKHVIKQDEEEPSPELFDRCFALLSALDGVPESADQLEDFYVPKPKKKTHPLRNVNQHKKQGQEAWLALMTLVDEDKSRKRILDIISTVIAPWFTKPELLSDFLTDCYNGGGSMSLLALSGVFYLISERNLDYPSFYSKLYSLLDRDILHSKHRSRFFRLLDSFLASTHLPAALVASFIKRLARLALNAPPGAIVFVTPWIYNLLKRHPTCTFMIHREVQDPEAKKYIDEHGAEDPFLPEETDPMQTQAIDSCLWELVQLQSHYHPNVATISKIISDQFTKQSYNIEDFLDHSYATLFEAEMTKGVKKAPVVEFQIPKKVFIPNEGESAGEPDSLAVKLWDFGGGVGTEVV
ncbi:hypothetical protein HG530_004673 [Fusarium avenaceum]|nr:CBF/Mak21 family-domain-containing protein [Fusarium avenaceum]KAI6770044.1 hypothetical protein HG530_004673 [Fusarium avenaceum]